MFRDRAASNAVRHSVLALSAALALACSSPLRAVILWSDLGATLVHETGVGSDILSGAVKRDDSASDTLYFKFHVDPFSDRGTEEYFAAFQLFEGGTDRLAVGNSLAAWAYSAFNTSARGELNKVVGDIDLRSAWPESSNPGVFMPYELPRRGIEITIVFRVQYVPGGDDQVTVWLNPDLAPGATETNQLEALTTRFAANASFNEIHLRHGGGGGGWTFSDMAIATSFSDLVVASNPDPAGAGRGQLSVRFRTWQREQGLPQNSVHALTQTADGYLWIGSDEGITRFDGVRFVSYGLREGLRGGRVQVLFEDASRTLWIGTAGGGLTRRQNGQFKTFGLGDGLPADSVTALAEDQEKRLWVGTDAGLVLWQGDRLVPFGPADQFKGRSIAMLYRDRHKVMWVGVSGLGVFRFEGGQFKPYADAAAEPLLRDPHCVLEDQKQRVWLGLGDDFVLCREGEQWRRYRIPRRLARPYVSTLVEQPDGTVWAGSVSEGLLQFKAGKPTIINASSGLSDNFVEALFVDREGNLWVGTGAGLNRLRRRELAVFAQNEGLGYGPVQGLAEVAPGLVWAGKPSDGLYVWDGRHFGRLDAELFRRFPQIYALLATRDGSCWAAGAHGLLHFPRAGGPEHEPEPTVIPGRRFLALAEAPDGQLWAGSREGELWRRQAGQWRKEPNFVQPHAITSLAPAPDGSVWLGTEGGGLYQFRDQVRVHLGKQGGLWSDLVRVLYLDTAGTLWIGTAGGGLSWSRKGEWVTVTTREGLPDNTISQILEDDTGHLWIGSNHGLACLSKHDLEEFAAGKIAALYPQVYGLADGMLSEECTGGFSPAALKTRSGQLWFATLKGVVVADPRAGFSDLPVPAVALEEIIVDGIPTELGSPNGKAGRWVNGRSEAAKARAWARSSNLEAPPSVPRLELPPGRHRVEFHYTDLSFSAPERLRFRCRLENLDSDWSEASTRRAAYYPYVPPGEYTFHVNACSSEGVWNEPGAVVIVAVQPYIWQTRWFLVLAALGLLGTVGGAARLVEKRKLNRRLRLLEQERALERERARIAQDLHDDLGASLTRISLLSELVKADKEAPAQVEAHAAKLSQSAGQTVRALEEIVWALRPGSDSLQSLVEYIAHFANELFEGDHARCRLDLPHDLPARSLPPEMRHNVFLVVKEALTNALKHAAAREVRVQAKATDHSLEIVVQDDGRGFSTETIARESQRQGLGNMQRRAQAMDANLSVHSAPGQGTTVTLRVRFPSAPGG